MEFAEHVEFMKMTAVKTGASSRRGSAGRGGSE